METSRIEYTLLFEDDTTQKFTVGPYDPNIMTNANIATIKSNIRTFLNSGLNSDTSKLLVSKYGNKWAGFNKVQVIAEDTTVYF